MGVPKFFRYTSERYPCLNELVKQHQIPDFDNMYLDMNGIIHNCSHPDDSNPHFRITEEKIFQDIFHYISILFQIIKPKKLFFMAIDGVAPRAKMNQQRGRRFRSAREAEKLEEEAKEKGEVLPTEKRFDSNCITPGTVFMARLHQQLRYFVKEKMSHDPLWAKVKVILSGHETPGEGEHKIMDYIRWARSQADYEPNTRHCLYGLDADLIMLGVCTHEPHFALLREEVKFGKTTQRATSPEETNFYLLHLSLLREYLEQEFITIKDNLPFPYDIENIVDDWVLMGFLVGNDFIPHLPNMHISNDALPLLYKTYMTVLPTLDGYINEAGDLNLARFEIFMQELAKIDRESFKDTYTDLKYFEAKTGRRPNDKERKEYKPNNEETFNINIDDIKANKPDDELQALINATHEMYLDEDEIDNEDYDETSDEEANMEMEFILHKKDYYMNKLDYSKVTEQVLADQAEGYVRAIQWNLHYYYKGCPSWCWYYPHHYAPYISDIKGFKDLNIHFELGEPFKPFEQLLAVLPAASKHLLPTPFHDLMTDEESPIVHYYPLHFETDLNGKRNDWEAVVLIPFIDEANLLSAMAPCYLRLTEEEQKRNTHGPMLVYNWTSLGQGPVESPGYFPTIPDSHAIETQIWRTELDVPEHQLKKGMLPNARRDMLFPGFPTMRHLNYKTYMRKGRVKVFDQQSRNENMIVELINEKSSEPVVERVASELLGKTIWAGWPHLTCAKVISVSNERMRLHHIDKQNNNMGPSYSTEPNQGNLHKQWISERSTIIEHNMNRLGIELGDIKIIVHAVNLKGHKYVIQDNVRMVLEPEWCTIPCGYALQAVVKDVSAYIMTEATKYSTPQEAYPPGDHVFLLTQGPYYGCLATVIESETVVRGRIKVVVAEQQEPTVSLPAAASPYRQANHAAAATGISTQMLSRITGTVFVVSGERNELPTETQNKVNIGLNLKFNKKNQEVSGYTRRCKFTNQWLYSARCIEVVKAYAKQFPELFDKLAHSLNNDIFFEGELWPGQVGQKKPQEVLAWLKSQPHSSAVRRECGSECLEPEEMKALAAILDPQLTTLATADKKVTLHVKWSLLYKPELHEGNIAPDTTADFKMYDRVVCVARNITAPLGAKGTITAIYQPRDCNTVRLSDKLNAEPSYQVMFDRPFPGGVVEDLFLEPRFYRMLPSNMLNISFGRKLRGSVTTQPAFGLNSAPTALRNDRARDSHHSAFASYSPPGDKRTQDVRNTPTNAQSQIPYSPPISSKPQTQNNNAPANTQGVKCEENATHLLRSLLRISDNDTDSVKRDKNTAQNLEHQNWRAKPETNQPPPPPPQRLQQQNWRTENAMNFNNTRPQQPGFSEWSNNSFKPGPAPRPPAQFPAPPPTATAPPFTHPFRGPPPQGHQPHLPQGHHPYQGHAGSFPGQVTSSGPPHGFPKHLPNVSGNVTLGPSWMDSEKDGKLSQSTRPATNPFVPLQVQTSRRRVQNTSGQSSRRNLQGLSMPNTVLPQPQTDNQPVMPQEQSNSSRQQRKRKPRIAANLPFQTD